MSLRVRKNPFNFIFDGPNLLVWVTHGKFELEGWIGKLFIVKPQANVHGERMTKSSREKFELAAPE